MFFFSSKRERLFWTWTTLVIVAIYSTLGLARTLATQLDNSGLGAPLFIMSCIAIAASVLIHALRTRPGRRELGAWLGIAATYTLVFVRMSIPEERTHLIEYSIVALLSHEALTERQKQGHLDRSPTLLAFLFTAAAGITDEVLQAFIPSRVFDPRDILFNTLAATLALTATTLIRHTQKPPTP